MHIKVTRKKVAIVILLVIIVPIIYNKISGKISAIIQSRLNAIPKEVNRLAVIINIYEAYSRGQNFSQVNNCYVHVVDPKSGKELVRYNISDDSTYGKETGIFVADIYRRDKEWKFKALGQGVKVKSISEMVRMKCR